MKLFWIMVVVLPEKDEGEWCEVKDLHSRVQV